ncbi:hypothetical protein [Adhaeribacter aquaticus]|uniref:hypothetical protein n=1 Tax=Adhaeribacter aquaticus TaxID=299567 RepID=UPI000422BFBF|nr:hypothetical protein [Adhaeribacter aquaticus]
MILALIVNVMKWEVNKMINKFFNSDVRDRLQIQAKRIGLKSHQAIDVITVAKNTVKEVLQAELKNGNYDQVVDFLKSSAFKVGKDLVLDKIIQRVVARFIIRFGLPNTVALNLAVLLVPFILKRVSKKALSSGRVQDFLNAIGVTDKVEKMNILKLQLKDKFTFDKKAAA